MTGRRPPVRIDIDELILDGIAVTQHDQPRLKSMIEAELGRLLTAGALTTPLHSAGVWSGWSAPSLGVPANNVHTLGRQIAHAIYGGIGS